MHASAFVYDTTEESFAQDVLEASREVPVLVDFWAPWCGPCQVLMPVLTQLAETYAGKFRLAKINIDEQQGLAAQFGVRSVPTVKLFRHGAVADEFMGALPEGQIRAFLERHIERESDTRLAEAIAVLTSGDREQGLDGIEAAAALEPENYRVRLQAAEHLLDGGRVEKAAALLEDLPIGVQTEPQVSALIARLEFARAAADAPPMDTLKARLEHEPADIEARYQLAAHQVVSGDYEAALEGLLEIMRRDRGWHDDAGRKGLLKVFELLGNRGELVQRYRARLSAALF